MRISKRQQVQDRISEIERKLESENLSDKERERLEDRLEGLEEQLGDMDWEQGCGCADYD